MRESGRLHHLDALRALTMVLILPAHALALIGLRSGWSDLEAAVFWSIHVFRLPLFFLVAGFFAALVLDARGLQGLLRNRGVRIGVPLVLGVIFVVPVLNVCLRAASAEPYKAFDSPLDAFTTIQPSYLWFLWYLAILYAAALLARHLLRGRNTAGSMLRRTAATLLSGRSAPLLLAAPAALLLYRQPTWIAGSAHTETFVPAPDLLAYYALFFACGWALFVVPGLRDSIESRPGAYAIGAAATLPPALTLYLLQGEPAIGQGRWFHLLALLLLSISTWAIAFSLLGLSRRHLSRPNPRLRYWADASYWIYLSHFVPMCALAALLLSVDMPDALRVGILTGGTLAVIYPAYGTLVRHTAIGRVLHGPRPGRDGQPSAVPTPSPPATASGT